MPDILTLTADEKLARLNAKAEWAKHHFGDLQNIIERFIGTEPKPYTVGFDHDSQPGYTRLYLLKDAEIPPPEIGLLAGDVAHNLRSALDHLTYYLWVVGTNGNGILGRKKPFGKAYFPIADDASEYKTSSVGKVEGMTDDAKKAVARTEPYCGGKGEFLWLLNELDIADKHHTLVTADIRAAELNLPLKNFSIKLLGHRGSARRIGGFTFPGFRAPAKAGEVIATFDAETYKDVEPTFDIAFSEPGAVEGKSVLMILKYSIDAIEDMLQEFRPLLA